MEKARNIELNNMKVKFHNLGGRPNDYGDVQIDISFEISDELKEQLDRDGYYTSQWTPKKDGKPDPDAEPVNLFKGLLKFRDKTGQLKPKYQRPEVIVVMEGNDNGVLFSESMLMSNFGGSRPRLEIVYADEIAISGSPRRDGNGNTAYINSIVLVCKKKSKYSVAAPSDEDEYDED
jgi:hypothetical protein